MAIQTTPNCRRGRTAAWLLVLGVAVQSWCAAEGADLPTSVQQLEQERIAAIAKAKRSSVSVFAGQGGGSGVVITPDGYALTNFHVSKPAGAYMRCSMPDGEIYDAVIVGIDPTGDVALIKLTGRDDFPHATMADSDKVRAGDWCFAVGNPFLLATDLQPTITWGIVSGVHRYQYPAGTLLEYADCIQTDAAINPGNSGGPLYNADGDLIGINGRGSFEKRGRVNVGVGYAISINQIKHFLGYLHSGRIVDHATLGASVATDEDGRVVVNDILESSDAYRRGLRYADEIVAFGGRPIHTVNSFKNALGIFPKGWRVPLSYRRDGRRYDVLVRLEGVHVGDELVAKVQGRRMKPPAPEEKDEEKSPPKEDDPMEESPERPKTPDIHPGAKKPEMPEHIAKMHETRSGYANYYFNKMHRDRVWKEFSRHADLSQRKGSWRIVAETSQGKPVEILLEDASARISQSMGETTADLTQDLDTQLGPVDSGGLLVAASLWRRLLLAGPQRYGEVYYLGTAPLPFGEPLKNLADVFVGTHDVSEARFLFDPATGHMLGLEMFPAPHTDPCEVYFGDFRDTEAGLLPHRWEIRHGDRVYDVLKIKSFDLPSAAKEEA